MGLKLPGGVRVIFSGEIESSSDELYSEIPVLIYYTKKPTNELGEFNPDILLMEPKKTLEFIPSREDKVRLPRGLNNDSVFSESLSRMVEGDTEGPESNSIDDNINIGVYKPDLKKTKIINSKIRNITKIIKELKKLK